MDMVTEDKKSIAEQGASAILNSLKRVQSTIPASGSDGLQYLKFIRGNWLFGRDDIKVETKDYLLADPFSVRNGFTCWTNRQNQKNENLGEETVGLGEPELRISDMPKKVDPMTNNEAEWKPQISIELTILGGNYDQTKLLYKTTSAGGRSLMRRLLEQISLQVERKGGKKFCPVINLKSSEYTHKLYRQISTPEFSICGWVDENESNPLATLDLDPSTIAVEAIDVTDEEPSPVSGRRRRRRALAEPAE
jgi:hypothetical protein